MPRNKPAQSDPSRSDVHSDPPDFRDELTVSKPETEAAEQEWMQSFDEKPRASTYRPGCRRTASTVGCKRMNASNTWFRQRPDLEDQSQQSYDFALACFGFTTGLTEQEITDLIIHHRALHKQKLRTTLDYFQRTISKAASHRDNQFPNHANSAPSGSENGQDSSGAPEPDRTAICKNVSVLFGVQIHGLTKIKGHSPVYHMELAEGKAEFPNTGKLISQAFVRDRLASLTGTLMRHFKPMEWEKIAQALLDACVIEEGGEEMELEGSARLRIDQYLSGATFIDSPVGQRKDTARQPIVADGVITVCASDIRTFINKTNAENITISAIVGMLSAVGAKNDRYRGKFPEQSRWYLPPDKFPASDYASAEELSDDMQ